MSEPKASAPMTPFAPRRLGGSGVTVSPMGIGTNKWGGRGADDDELLDVYRAARDRGVTFVDTAEVYTMGKSERVVGECVRADGRPVVVASKFAPYPHRLRDRQFRRALDRSLDRVGVETIDLYYLHWPFSLVGVGDWMEDMADAVEAGRIRAVGISNCSASQMRRAVEVLERHGIALAANQVQYHVGFRKPERTGVLDACRELDVALVAYRPLGGGKLTSGVADAIGRVASDRGVSRGQVALNWLLCRDERIIPIPGASKARNAADNAAALTWKLTDEEFAALEAASQ